MPRLKATPELIENILARVPEGLLHKSTLGQRLELKEKNGPPIQKIIETSHRIGAAGEYFYDSTRLSAEQAAEFSRYCRAIFPNMRRDGTLPDAPISDQRRERNLRLSSAGDEEARRMISLLDETPGYAQAGQMALDDRLAEALKRLLNTGDLRQSDGLIYDPLRLSRNTVREVSRRQRFLPLHQELTSRLQSRPGGTAPWNELAQTYGAETLRQIITLGGFSTFQIAMEIAPYTSQWVRLADTNPDEARQVATDAVKISDEDWRDALELCGDVTRPGAKPGKSIRAQVLARSHLVGGAAKRIGVRAQTLELALGDEQMVSFIDPEGKVRLPAYAVEAAAVDEVYREKIAAYEVLKAREIAMVAGVDYAVIRARMRKAGISRAEPQWEQVRGRWGLPNTLVEFRAVLHVRLEAWREERETRDAERRRQMETVREHERILRELERQRRDLLRARLVAAFPAWKHDRRGEQQIRLHVGPPNSGKTYDTLQALMRARSGWYLAPLRLLAYEIFDRLNQQGVPCNLLTGEEYIPVDGATITAATVEMFNPDDSRDCIVIDEGQMIADPDRGWAWTRAMMEAQAPEIHVISPHTAQGLIEKLAASAAIPLEITEHHRLAPIQVAERHWPLDDLPPRTILVAFSRRMVLSLKMELEKQKRRVSVIYGNLPPEVRRRQADRFASGETEICVATDAVGMGLNLPADYVCFYELEKFDGKMVRVLHPAEVQQIGGRAGRYGLSTIGEVGATNKRDLKLVRQLFAAPAEKLTHARVAPSVEDLAMIPGNLAGKLVQWSSLQSIPDSLRGAIRTCNMDERIELARMLADHEVDQLGLEASMRLINAPTRQDSREYWRRCTTDILAEKPMPLPPESPKMISTGDELEATERSVTCADIYLWLARRPEFRFFAPEEFEVRQMRAAWSQEIDDALMKRLNLARRCPRCGAILPLSHRHRLCDNCYYGTMHDFE
jgi:ribosomal protein S27AE